MNTLTRYLNTDLLLRSLSDLTDFLAHLPAGVVALNASARPLLAVDLEIHHEGGPDAAVNAFCQMIESLPGEARSAWDTCVERTFDIGFNAGVDPWPFRADLEAATVGRAAALGARLAISIYPLRKAAKGA